MNDLTDVLAQLKDAIESLQSREHELTPLEKLKLKALRLNLHAAQDSPSTGLRVQDLGAQGPHARATRMGTVYPFPRSEALALDQLEGKLRALRDLSLKTRAETKLLLAEARSHVARGRSLCDAVRLASQSYEHGCIALSNALSSKRREISAAAAT